MAGIERDQSGILEVSSDAAQLLAGIDESRPAPPEKIIGGDAPYGLIITTLEGLDEYRAKGKEGMGVTGAVLLWLSDAEREKARARHEQVMVDKMKDYGVDTLEALHAAIEAEQKEWAKRDLVTMRRIIGSTSLWGRIQLALPNRMRTRRFRI